VNEQAFREVVYVAAVNGGFRRLIRADDALAGYRERFV
jgi:hypothetical protein